MGKNNKLINQMRALGLAHQMENTRKAAEEMTPMFYAAMALALKECFGFGTDRTIRAFEKTREIWEAHEGRGKDLIKECEDALGITIVKNQEEEVNE